jgi:hypothetical protein
MVVAAFVIGPLAAGGRATAHGLTLAHYILSVPSKPDGVSGRIVYILYPEG